MVVAMMEEPEMVFKDDAAMEPNVEGAAFMPMPVANKPTAAQEALADYTEVISAAIQEDSPAFGVSNFARAKPANYNRSECNPS